MLITVIWGACVTVGKCDIQNSVAVDNHDTKGFSLVGSGVSTDIWTSDSAMIMAVSVLPFIVVQFPQIMHSDSGRHLAVLLGLIVSVIQPTLQRRRLAFAKHRHLRSRILKYLKMRALGRLMETLTLMFLRSRLFKSIDVDEDEHLSHSELRALVVGMRLSEINLSEDDAVDKVMKDFDQTENNLVDEKEFIAGIGKWLEEAKSSKIDAHLAGPDTLKYIHEYYEETKKEHDLLGDDGVEDDEEAGVDDPRRTSIKAVLYLLLGTCIAAAFADPLVDAVGGFSTATSIPSFYISFIFLPLATNSSDAVSAIIFATRKKQRSASLTFSELYGAVTMNNNILCLSVFLALVYVRGLTWDFSSEVLVILIVCIVMGVFGSLRTTFPLWTSFIAFALLSIFPCPGICS
ncbi:putative EF-hand domain, calcium/proton exchanger, sodium/calcium exchanger membrane region [Helianthus annuus]|nr:putative EF-hand domain, calcium/proton exchanger, sodium/calcium exchanger membrane region [Helianthus annuus]